MYLPGPGSSFMTGLLRQGCGVGSPGFLFPMPAKELRVSLSEAPDDLTSRVAGEHPSFFFRNELVSDCVVYTRVCLSYLGDRRPPKAQQYVPRSTVNARQQHQIPNSRCLKRQLYAHITTLTHVLPCTKAHVPQFALSQCHACQIRLCACRLVYRQSLAIRCSSH